MQTYSVAIVGGGASGLMATLQLQQLGIQNIAIFDGNERPGRKLSATGNGQGNISNMHLTVDNYFSSNRQIVDNVLRQFSVQDLITFFENLGLYVQFDSVGRLYPLCKQANVVTDILRFAITDNTTQFLSKRILKIEKKLTKAGNLFLLKAKDEEFYAKKVILATGGMAGACFGTDGTGYTFAKAFGHTITSLTPSITRLIVDKNSVSGLKGVRVYANVTLMRQGQAVVSIAGDIVFADGMLGGDSIYKISAFYRKGDSVSIDFLPTLTEQESIVFLESAMSKNRDRPLEEILKGLLHGSIARFIVKLIKGNADSKLIIRQIKAVKIDIQKPAAFDLAQVTKGGVDMREVDENLRSKFCENLYFTGEILDCDGECGGYNLQWAFSSAVTVARAIARQK